jgi:hypothetical protein
MAEFSATLSSAGFTNIDLDRWDDDFEFIVGSSPFRYSRLAASFLSLKVVKLPLVDRTLKCYSVGIIGGATIFESFLGICSDCKVVNSSKRSLFSSIAWELGNHEMFWQIEDGFEGGNWISSVEAACVRYLKKRSQNCELHE